MNEAETRAEYIDPELACHELVGLVGLVEGQLTITPRPVVSYAVLLGWMNK